MSPARVGVKGFSGRSAIVTGGGSGIGAALTDALVAVGAKVRCADIDLDAAKRVAAQAAGPGTAVAVELDVIDPAAVRAVVDDVVAETGAMCHHARCAHVAHV